MEQMALDGIDFLQVRVVAYGLDAFLLGNHLVVAGHHHHGAEFQSFGLVHGADGNMPAVEDEEVHYLECVISFNLRRN